MNDTTHTPTADFRDRLERTLLHTYRLEQEITIARAQNEPGGRAWPP